MKPSDFTVKPSPMGGNALYYRDEYVFDLGSDTNPAALIAAFCAGFAAGINTVSTSIPVNARTLSALYFDNLNL